MSWKLKKKYTRGRSRATKSWVLLLQHSEHGGAEGESITECCWELLGVTPQGSHLRGQLAPAAFGKTLAT